MAFATCYVALPFERTREGFLMPREAQDCFCADSAKQQAQALSETFAGAVAFARDVDPAMGVCRRARHLGSFGDVPRLTYLLEAA